MAQHNLHKNYSSILMSLIIKDVLCAYESWGITTYHIAVEKILRYAGPCSSTFA